MVNILVKYVEKFVKKEILIVEAEAEAIGRYFIFALIEAKRINKYKEIVEYIEERMLEEKKVDFEEENEKDIGGDRMEEKVRKYEKKRENFFLYF